MITTLAPGLFTATTAYSNEMQDTLLNILDRAFTVHDYSTVLEYVGPQGINYFGRAHTSGDYIRRDMIGDAKTYSRCKTVVNAATFHRSFDGSYTLESVREETEAWEVNGKHHHAHCIFSIAYLNNPLQLVSVSLKTVSAAMPATSPGEYEEANSEFTATSTPTPTPASTLEPAPTQQPTATPAATQQPIAIPAPTPEPTPTQAEFLSKNDNSDLSRIEETLLIEVARVAGKTKHTMYANLDSESAYNSALNHHLTDTGTINRYITEFTYGFDPALKPDLIEGVGRVTNFIDFQYTLTAYEAVRTYGPLHTEPDDGATFVWIAFTAKNTSVKTARVNFDAIELSDANGLTYDYSNKGPLFNTEYIQPTLSKPGQILFEVASDAIGKPMKLIFRDSDYSPKETKTVLLPPLTKVGNN